MPDREAKAASSREIGLTWERLVPKQMADDPASRTIKEIHFRRYETAARLVGGRRVLDVACGTGYGSQILARAGASSVLGVDVSPDAVGYARHHYSAPRLQFLCADAENFQWPEPFDVVISFETIEHLHDPTGFLTRLRRLLARGGQFIMSVPLGETRHIDRFHRHAFTEGQVFTLLAKAGFTVERFHRDDWFLNRVDLLRWHRLYPTGRPSWTEQFFTLRGWRVIMEFIFRGGVALPMLCVTAHADA